MFVDQCYDDVCFPVVVEFLFPPHFLLMLIIPVGHIPNVGVYCQPVMITVSNMSVGAYCQLAKINTPS